MTVEEYEKIVSENWKGATTVEYCAIGFAGEAGEVLNEIKKEMRDNSIRQELIRDEIGDTLYYMVKLARLYGYSMSDIMEANSEKLKIRREHPVTMRG